MERFKVYGLSSTIVVSIIAIGLVIYIVMASILAMLVWFMLAALAFALISALIPRFYRRMSETVDLRDNAINSRKAEIAGLICTECKRTGVLIESASADADTESARGELGRLGQELAALKCCSSAFEVEADGLASVEFTFLTTKSAEIRDRLGAIKRSVAGKYLPVAKKRDSEREEAVRRLVLAGYALGGLNPKFEGLLAREPADLEEAIGKEQEMRAIISEIEEECLGEAARISAQEPKRKGADEISSAVERLRKEKKSFPESAKALSELRMRVCSILAQDFLPARGSLMKSLIAAARASESPALAEFNSKVREKADFLKKLDDPGRMGELAEIEKSYRELAASSLAEIFNSMQELKKELSAYSLPRELTIKQLPRLEAPKGTLPEFTKKLTAALSEAAPALELLSRNARIMRSYPKVEKLIDGRLAESGKALGRDLGVKYPEIFFALYRKSHPKVKFTEFPEPKIVLER